jgi:hypothetical protein
MATTSTTGHSEFHDVFSSDNDAMAVRAATAGASRALSFANVTEARLRSAANHMAT